MKTLVDLIRLEWLQLTGIWGTHYEAAQRNLQFRLKHLANL
jgi:hypothetical protein